MLADAPAEMLKPPVAKLSEITSKRKSTSEVDGGLGISLIVATTSLRIAVVQPFNTDSTQ